MIFIEQKIKGVYLIKPKSFNDERGVFRRNFCTKEFKKYNINNKVTQANISENINKYTLRGFHYQIYPYSEAKTLTCIKGNIYDVVVDLRKSSKTYLKWIAIKLNENNRWSIHVPKGCANAFLTLTKNCIIHYYCSNKYNSNKEKGIRYNDQIFKFKWPHKPKYISKKDRSHKDYKP
jgi:dTDP-4-dehydrorhamnose 3,5-epimerase